MSVQDYPPVLGTVGRDLVNQDIADLSGLRTVAIPIKSLRLSDALRHDGINDEHCRLLADSGKPLPAIVVHGHTMRVIDGIHRMHAAVLRGEHTIEARIFEGSVDDAFVLGVRLNITHGLPLTRADRTVAAARIIQSHAGWSNRLIAAAAGLSAGTVAGIRRRSTTQNVQSIARTGKDGRIRPVNGAKGRLRVRALLAIKPDASIRAIAREAQVSPSTVHDVRKRLRTERDAVPERQRPQPLARSTHAGECADAVATLMKDPALRFSDAGRRLIRWLDACQRGLPECAEIVEVVPPHCIDIVARVAREYARSWDVFAGRLEERQLLPNL